MSINVPNASTSLTNTVSGTIGTFAGMQHEAPFAAYFANRVILADGSGSVAQANTRGDLTIAEQFSPVAEDNTVGVIFTQPRATASSTGTWANYSSATLIGTAGVSVNAAAGRVRDIAAVNHHATNLYYLLLCDKASAPVQNDLPIDALILTPTSGSTPLRDFGPDGKKVTLGTAYAISSQCDRVDLPTTSSCAVFIRYM